MGGLDIKGDNVCLECIQQVVTEVRKVKEVVRSSGVKCESESLV